MFAYYSICFLFKDLLLLLLRISNETGIKILEKYYIFKQNYKLAFFELEIYAY